MLIKLTELKVYPGNPRKISDEELNKLKRSLSEFGIVQPLIVNKKNEVIGGNQRLKAMLSLNIAETECIVVDLPKDKEKALNLALNKISGEWDDDLLKDFMEDLDLIDLELSGFAELEEIETENLEYHEKELTPYKQVHVLLSFPPEKLQDIQDALEGIQQTEGIEYVQSAN